MFDIETFAYDYGIQLHYPGESEVTRGWVNVSCPFCPFGDHKWHLGFKVGGDVCSCWRCGHKSGPVKFVMGVLNESYHNATKIVHEYEAGNITATYEKTKSSFSMPLGTQEGLGKAHIKYLKSRFLNYEHIIDRFHLHHTDHLGKPCMSIVIPVFHDGQIVSYVCRDVTGRAERKYYLCPSNIAIKERSELLYNFDKNRKIGMVVEGVTDVWRIGDGCFATFGTRFSAEQLQLIANSKLEKVFVAFDGDGPGLRNGQELAAQLGGVVAVEHIILHHGDPAEQDDETVHALQELLIQ